MNIIETSAPISIENLKKYFIDKSIQYLIDYDQSSLREQKLLTYLGNLDIPCDINFDPEKEEHLELLKIYFETSILVNIESLEIAAINCLFEYKKLSSSTTYSKFISENLDTIKEWSDRLDSLSLYNVWTIDSNELKEWVEKHPEDNADSSKFVNFVSLLKHEEFYLYFEAIDKSTIKNYKFLFNEYCFKGKNLYTYWANENNPMFLLTWGISSGLVNPVEYIDLLKKDSAELLSADK